MHAYPLNSQSLDSVQFQKICKPTLGDSLVKIFVGSLKIHEDLHEDPYADLRRSL